MAFNRGLLALTILMASFVVATITVSIIQFTAGRDKVDDIESEDVLGSKNRSHFAGSLTFP